MAILTTFDMLAPFLLVRYKIYVLIQKFATNFKIITNNYGATFLNIKDRLKKPKCLSENGKSTVDKLDLALFLADFHFPQISEK